MKVAVILNENELQRYGHPNIIPFFERIFSKDSQKYSFIPFTSINIDTLFSSGKKGVLNYDSIYISTNACNDIDILSKLVDNATLIEEFINAGHGIFIGYQKKLSTTNKKNSSFLPEIYSYDVVRKEIEYENWMKLNDIDSYEKNGVPILEKSSSSGYIRINPQKSQDVVLNYPRVINSETIEERCRDEKNGFRSHVYRAIIRPKFLGAYDVLLWDDSYENARPLLCKCVAGNNERIVITSIALDWEQHQDILYNIIKYITEGTPHIALITDSHNTDGNFRYLISNMSLNKITHCVLSLEWLRASLSGNDDYIKKLIKVYAFSSSVPRRLVDDFWHANKSINQMRVYYFEKNSNDGDQVLLEYSNISSIDSLINNVLLWVNSHYSGGMFKGSFWTTYDTLTMYKKLNLQFYSFIPGVFKDIFENHYFKDDDGSYDGLIGCTVGLLELMIDFKEEIETYYPNINMYIEKTIIWIIEKAKSVSQYEQLSIINSLCRLKLEKSLKENKPSIYDIMLTNITWDMKHRTSLLGKDYCRFIEFCLNHNENYDSLLLALMSQQDEYGAWNGIGRTANIIIFLVENYEKLEFGNSIEIQERLYRCIEMGVIFLTSEFNEKSSCWANDFLSTVKATLAIGIYNKHFKYTTKDFSETIRRQAKELINSELTTYAISTISSQRNEINELNDRLTQQIEKLESEKNEIIKCRDERESIFAKEHNELEYSRDRIKTHGKIIITLTCLCIILLLLIVLKYNVYIDVFKKALSFFDINDIITNTASSVVLFWIGGFGTYLLIKFVNQRPKKNKKQN